MYRVTATHDILSGTPFSAVCTAFSPTKSSSEMLFKTLSYICDTHLILANRAVHCSMKAVMNLISDAEP